MGRSKLACIKRNSVRLVVPLYWLKRVSRTYRGNGAVFILDGVIGRHVNQSHAQIGTQRVHIEAAEERQQGDCITTWEGAPAPRRCTAIPIVIGENWVKKDSLFAKKIIKKRINKNIENRGNKKINPLLN